MTTYLYTTTDAKEVKAIVGNPNLQIMDIDINYAQVVQRDFDLGFLPASFLAENCALSPREIKTIVGKLVGEKQFVAVYDGKAVQQYFQKEGDN